MPALVSRERRLLLMVGFVTVGAVGYVYVVEPLVEAHARDGDWSWPASVPSLTRQERLVARSDTYGREPDAPSGDRRAPPTPPGGDKAPVAASELQKLVKTTAGGRDRGPERADPRLGGPRGLAEVPVEMTLTGPIRGSFRFSTASRKHRSWSR